VLEELSVDDSAVVELGLGVEEAVAVVVA